MASTSVPTFEPVASAEGFAKAILGHDGELLVIVSKWDGVSPATYMGGPEAAVAFSATHGAAPASAVFRASDGAVEYAWLGGAGVVVRCGAAGAVVEPDGTEWCVEVDHLLGAVPVTVIRRDGRTVYRMFRPMPEDQP